jgi:hypothetical protein
VLAEVVNRDDVAVRELAGRAGLAEEPLTLFAAGLDRPGDDLDGDDALEERVERAVTTPIPPWPSFSTSW